MTLSLRLKVTLAALNIAGGFLLTASGCEESSDIGEHSVRENNRAVGLMGQYEYDDAVGIWQTLVAAHPKWTDGQVNLALAILNRQKDGDESAARQMLQDICKVSETNPRAQYLAGFLALRAGDDAEARTRFMNVIALDPDDPYAWYHLGVSSETTHQDEAYNAYRTAVELDPYLRSAWYRLSQLGARIGRDTESTDALDTFERLENNPRATMVKPIYGRLGRNAYAATIDSQSNPFPEYTGPLWLASRPIMLESIALGDDGGSRTIAVADIDGDEDLDIFLAGVGKGSLPNAVLIQEEPGVFSVAPNHPLASVDDVNFAMFGDLGNDGSLDVILGRDGRNRIFTCINEIWIDRSSETALGEKNFNSSDGAIVDIDHDGDLDVLFTNRNGPLEIYADTGNIAFRDISSDTGLDAATFGTQLLIADLDNSSDLDVMVIRNPPDAAVSSMIFLNDRLWSFTQDPRYQIIEEAPTRLAIAADIDATGKTQLFTVNTQNQLLEWTADQEDAFVATKRTIYPADVSTLVAMDQNGDGTLEIVADVDLDLSDMQSWAPLLLDPIKGYSAIAIPKEGYAQPVLIPAGNGRYPFTSITLAGGDDPTQQLRSNSNGIGSLVSARRQSTWTIQRYLRSSSGPGQSLQPLPLGLGRNTHLDFIVIDWPDGLIQTELPSRSDGDEGIPSLTAGSRDHIVEMQRLASSCPVIFAFNGERMNFVSDVLGVAGIGYMIEPGTYGEPRPFERFPMPPGSLRPDDEGQLQLVVCEPMEEVCYLDGVSLTGWQLPAGWNIAIDERMSIEGPIPTGKELFYRESISPIAARNDRNENVLPTLLTIDKNPAPPGVRDQRFIGRLEHEHVLELEFSEPLDQLSDPWLLMSGWIEYPYSQTMFASWQSGAKYNAPTLEARGRTGEWSVVQEHFGYPAGMPRTATFPLANLPVDTTALRIRTNQEIYWDQLHVINVEPQPTTAQKITAPLLSAELSAVGYPKPVKQPHHRPDYDYAHRTPLFDFQHQTGLYTDFGPVEDLVESADQNIVTIGPGEGITMSFEYPKGIDPETLHWVVDFHGWCKDRDRFTKTGRTLEPLPGNTPRANRMESGR